MKNFWCVMLISALLASCNLSLNTFRMTNDSMLPTIRVGSLVKITRQLDSLNYGDLVVVDHNEIIDELYGYRLQGPLIYRVLGMPGDCIAVEKEFCTINGKKNEYQLVQINVQNKDANDFFKNSLTEYKERLPNGVIVHIYRAELSDKDIEMSRRVRERDDIDKYSYMNDDMETIKIIENHYFLMGDFRSNTIDSRIIGTIPKEKIIGKVTKIKQKIE